MRNKIGPNTVPWGTPDVTGTGLEDIPFTTTVCVRSDRKAWIQSSGCFLVYRDIGVYKEGDSVVPYQIAKSIMIKSVCMFLLLFLASS